MSEKKYHVELKNTYKHDKRLLSLNKVSGKIDFVDWRNSGAWWKGTKSELAKIMDGALYKQTDSLPFEWFYSFESLKEKLGWEFNESIDKWEYTNSIIELVPVEIGGH